LGCFFRAYYGERNGRKTRVATAFSSLEAVDLLGHAGNFDIVRRRPYL